MSSAKGVLIRCMGLHPRSCLSKCPATPLFSPGIPAPDCPRSMQCWMLAATCGSWTAAQASLCACGHGGSLVAQLRLCKSICHCLLPDLLGHLGAASFLQCRILAWSWLHLVDQHLCTRSYQQLPLLPAGRPSSCLRIASWRFTLCQSPAAQCFSAMCFPSECKILRQLVKGT